MSASREKKTRQEQAAVGYTDPKELREAEQRKAAKRSNMLYGLIAVVFVLVAAAAMIWRSNIIPRGTTAVTIDGEKYTAAEVSFYYRNVYNSFLNNYYNYFSYIGFDYNTDPAEQTVNATAASLLGTEEGITWKKYFEDSTFQQMASLQAALKEAKENGYTYSDSMDQQYAASVQAMKDSAASSGATVSKYLQANMGSLMTEKVYKEQLLRAFQYNDYIAAYQEGLTYSDDALEEAYKADQKTYDVVSYEYVYVSGAAASTTDADGNTVEPTEEESAAAKAKAKETANAVYAAYQEGSALEDAAAEAGDAAKYSSTESGTYYESDMMDWLFDDARKAGDSTLIESGNLYYVLHFYSCGRQEYNTVDVRHILIKPETGEKQEGEDGYEAEQSQLKADAKAKAEELLAQWKAGDATEDSFAALAKENSADSNAAEGGLYTSVTKGRMVETFNDWIYDASRKVGDTGVVETEYGYHVMYFSGTNPMPYWKEQVTQALRTKDLTAWNEGLTTDAVIEQSESGMKYVA